MVGCVSRTSPIRSLVALLVATGVAMMSALPVAVANEVVPVMTVPDSPVITGVDGGATRGQLVVTYAPLEPIVQVGTRHEFSLNGQTWSSCVVAPSACIIGGLTDGRRYDVYLRAINAIGPSAAAGPVAGIPAPPAGVDRDKPLRLPSPRTWVNATFTAAGNELGSRSKDQALGVGTLPRMRFSKPISNKAAVERHLLVTATNAQGVTYQVPGAWGWIDDRSVIFRPKSWWPGRSLIEITSTLDRAVLGTFDGDYVVGSKSLATTYSFRTARRLIARVDGDTKEMRVFVDDQKVKTFRVSLGSPGWETRNGVKVISTSKEADKVYTSAALGLDDPADFYELPAPWNTRLTPTGEFLHTAPWAYGRLGRYNGSHGCTNMFEADAKWIFDKTIPGDVVLFVNTGGSTVEPWNGPGGLWNIPWDKWLKKSALTSGNAGADTSGDFDSGKPSDVKPAGV
jgi:lipoprotein-anchoring transpeptidase ErfK/SrfK